MRAVLRCKRHDTLSESSLCGGGIVFLLVEPPQLRRGMHLHSVDWDTIKGNMLPHKSSDALMHRYIRTVIIWSWYPTRFTFDLSHDGVQTHDADNSSGW